MCDSQATTLSSLSDKGTSAAAPSGNIRDVDFSPYPRIYFLPIHADAPAEEVELKLSSKGAKLASHIEEAQIVLTDATKAPRAKYELQSLRVRIEPINESAANEENVDIREPAWSIKRKRPAAGIECLPPRKVRRTSASSSIDSEPEPDESDHEGSSTSSTPTEMDSHPLRPDQALELGRFRDRAFVKVVTQSWLDDSLANREIQLLANYTIIEGHMLLLTGDLANQPYSTEAQASSTVAVKRPQTPEPDKNVSTIPQLNQSSPQSSSPRYSSRNMSFRRNAKKPPLLRETTSEHETETQTDTPEWVRENKIYACERVTLQHCANEKFIEQLRTIRHGRELQQDEIGVRAYSSIIASVAAYPYPLRTAREIATLPGCDKKAVTLFRQFQAEGCLKEAHEMKNDPDLEIKDLFWNTHGVGPKTATQFFRNGWKELADVVEYGWSDLTFEQKVGVKFYDEFKMKIPRPESEQIASTIAQHARNLLGDEVQYMIVGGYRRGKSQSGDVDVVVSHPDESKTLNLIEDLRTALAESGWVTHELELHTSHSQRAQQPIPASILRDKKGGFDTLDKALLVWQDPNWPTKQQDLAADPKAKNLNVHRRVDIIISPWKTVGCAVMGWTSGTTFQRDVRRYAKYVKNWKFDSTGVRDRKTGDWLDLERWKDPSTRAKTMEEAEKRVFEGFGLEWKEPWERCTD